MRDPNAIDFWRGLALVTIFINHIPGNAFERATFSHYTLSDAAELFVFLAGWSLLLATEPKGAPETVPRVLLRLATRTVEVYRTPLARVAAALQQSRAIKVLSLGPPSTGGLASGSSSATSAPRLQGLLEKVLPGSEVTMVQRGLPGEITAGSTERIMNMVTEVEPDLVIWKVGAQDALAKVQIEPFATALGEVLEWLNSHDIDVLLIQPPYAAAMAADEHYARLLGAIGEVARQKDVPIVLRFEAGQFLSQQRTEAAQNQFRLFELGQHCISEYVARAVENAVKP